MSNYVGTIGKRISVDVTLCNIFEYIDYKFSYYGTAHFTYIMRDSDGNVFVWKTTSTLMLWDEANERNDTIRKGDTMSISGTVKEHSEYKETKQTVLTRCKFSLIAHAPDPVEIKREQQMQSLEDGDFVWEMPYKQYKEHYSDCETVAGSFDDEEKTIKVIIRSGRLKNSGVRGQHYKGFQFKSDNGVIVCYRAISEETALRRLKKEYPNGKGWECVKIFNYDSCHRYF